jgi:hypothetical protein
MYAVQSIERRWLRGTTLDTKPVETDDKPLGLSKPLVGRIGLPPFF